MITQQNQEKMIPAGDYLVKGIYKTEVHHYVWGDDDAPISEYWENPVISMAIIIDEGVWMSETEIFSQLVENNRPYFENCKIDPSAKTTDFDFEIFSNECDEF